jgi:hypothetical protein
MVACSHKLGRTLWWQEHESERLLHFMVDKKQREDEKDQGTR